MNRGQGSPEFLLLLGGIVLVAGIAIAIISSLPAGSTHEAGKTAADAACVKALSKTECDGDPTHVDPFTGLPDPIEGKKVKIQEETFDCEWSTIEKLCREESYAIGGSPGAAVAISEPSFENLGLWASDQFGGGTGFGGRNETAPRTGSWNGVGWFGSGLSQTVDLATYGAGTYRLCAYVREGGASFRKTAKVYLDGSEQLLDTSSTYQQLCVEKTISSGLSSVKIGVRSESGGSFIGVPKPHQILFDDVELKKIY